MVPAPDQANLEKLAHVLKRLDAEVEGADEFDSEELAGRPEDLIDLERLRQVRDT